MSRDKRRQIRLGSQISECVLFFRSLKGKVIAIEVDSGEYFTGETILDAASKARAKHPGKGFHFFRVGFPYVYVWR